MKAWATSETVEVRRGPGVRHPGADENVGDVRNRRRGGEKVRVSTRGQPAGLTSSQAPEKSQKGRPVHDQKQVGEIVRGSTRGQPGLVEPPLRHHQKELTVRC